MPWWYAVAERDHAIQNPTSEEKIRLLGERLRLAPGMHVLDVACGKCGPALVLASEFGCRVTGIERAPEFVAAARERIADAGLEALIDVIEADASSVPLACDEYDVALCLGASFVWNGLTDTLAALTAAVRPEGQVAVGEPYWRRWPLPESVDPAGFATLEETSRRFEAGDLLLETLIASSLDDWDRYESLHWLAVQDWLSEHPDDPDASEFRRLHTLYRDEYLSWGRELLGWAIFAGRKLRGAE